MDGFQKILKSTFFITNFLVFGQSKVFTFLKKHTGQQSTYIDVKLD